MDQRSARLGIDVGGTFTDIVLALGDGRVFVNKTTTTPRDPSLAILDGIEAVLAESGLAGGDIAEIVHGTTVASNAILQKTGARTGLLATQGFRDVLEIARIRTPTMFDMTWRKPTPLVPRRWRLEARERIAAAGDVVVPLDEASVRDAARRLRAEGVEAVAICFINSYVNAAHERRAAAIFAAETPEILVTASCDVLPELKEYERTSTSVVNAYVLPAMRAYLDRLRERLAARGMRARLQVMASNGGMIGLEAARTNPVFAVASGPAGGVTGAARLGGLTRTQDVIVFDMGGTTAKASIIEGGLPALTSEYEFRDGISSPSRFNKGAGYMLKVPAIDIAEVGAGGGSLASVDAGGLLRVGPESAGGDPGPACYGRGNDRPTVTDANMVLGMLNPEALAGGSLRVERARAAAAVEAHVGARLGLDAIAAAHGIRSLANVSMARAIRAVTVERGKDPRAMALMVFGGGGPLHAVDVARLLGIARVIVPPMSGVFSAAGMLAADMQRDFVRPVLQPLEAATQAEIEASLATLVAQGHAALAREGYDTARIALTGAADLHLLGQSSELTVPLAALDFAPTTRAQLLASFRRLYAETFGYATDEPVELVNLRLSARGLAAAPLDFARLSLASRALAGADGTRKVAFARDAAAVATRLLARASIGAAPVAGPAIIESYDTTILLPPGTSAHAIAGGSIVIDIAPEEPA